jgi:hypothetical protein
MKRTVDIMKPALVWHASQMIGIDNTALLLFDGAADHELKITALMPAVTEWTRIHVMC